MKRESESVEMGLSEANIILGDPALPEGQIKEPTGHLVPQASEFMATIEKTPCASFSCKMFVVDYSTAAIDVILTTNNSITTMKTELAARKSLVSGYKPSSPQEGAQGRQNPSTLRLTRCKEEA